MASAILAPSAQALGSAQRKRDSRHLALPSPSKRSKNASITGAGRVGQQSPLPTADRARGLKAEKWFDENNRNASRAASFPDNDPPFYINRPSSLDGGSACAVHSDSSSVRNSVLGNPTGPTRSLLARMVSSESNSEDFRSVIDDLTVENKKLKKKLRQYERLHCSHLQQDKLFEIRVHGLAAHRKRELEHTLRSFASSIDLSSDAPASNFLSTRPTASNSGPSIKLHTPAATDYPPAEPILPSRKPSSGSTSCSRPIDSAYASMSGQTAVSQSQSQDKGRFDPPSQASRTRNVASYLHDIPETLMPQHTMIMSERAKSKLVVKRLEQIFTGKGAASRRHTQSHQQQEVSQSAARADRSHVAAQGQDRGTVKEGMREARILPDDTSLQIESLSETDCNPVQSRRDSHGRRGSPQAITNSGNQSPDQRPTRPLDLDLHRAQVPADNIDYIRHLGASPSASATSTARNDGWVYLNLLTSMAQLHTLNVTPDFIRRAVANVSSKFELSPDGTKLRWRGGHEGSMFSSDSDSHSDVDRQKATLGALSAKGTSSVQSLRDSQEPNTGLPRSTYEPLADPGLATNRRPVFLEKTNSTADFQYKPLFFHGLPSKDSDESDDDSDSITSSGVMENATGFNSGINSGSHGLRETEVKMRKQNAENGPIIFYHKARFCTDLSGDVQGSVIDESAYHRLTQGPIGASPEDLSRDSDDSEESEPDEMDLEVELAKEGRSTLDLDDLKSCISSCVSSDSVKELAPIPMESAGLGGVHPKDNFMVAVQVQHRRKRRGRSGGSSGSVNPTSMPLSKPAARPARLTKILPRSQPVDMPVASQITGMAKTELEPSTLPPASYLSLPFLSSDPDDDEDEDEDDEDDDEQPPPVPYQSTSRPPIPIVDPFAARPMGFSLGSSSDETKESSYADSSSGADDDDDSIDLLAHARQLDPDTIAAQERDFEDNVRGPAAAVDDGGAPVPFVYIDDDSDVDSMSVDEDGRSRMEDSE